MNEFRTIGSKLLFSNYTLKNKNIIVSSKKIGFFKIYAYKLAENCGSFSFLRKDLFSNTK